ncbi:hypothetical protein J7E88_14490 [Streptomyces sp. ISL-10]|uniref:hypothetical protein n=1 Tax=Streptomyces sp. ISL-10 TaxID=2819172 RepID=UPI001BECE9BA|nr:hypothetical protein [Streptomyces sp. ISL-10]MBT2366482.1 hypothetical protein [Streptomyces sp. ISL-10]
MSSTDKTQRSPRHRRSPLVVASVAAAVLVAGGGGAYVATTGLGGGTDTASDAKSDAPRGGPAPLLSLDAPGSAGESTGSIAPGEPDPNDGGGTVYRAAGDLPEGPERAAVYRAAGSVTEAEVARLAKALGVTGSPRLAGTAWKIGADKDGSGPMLQVNKDAPGTWTFARYGAAPRGDDCPKGKDCPADGSVAPDESGPAVDEAAAKKAAAPVLAAVGQGDAKLDARQLMGAVRVVNADPVVGGLPTYGWSTGIQVGADGQVIGGSGQLKKPVKSHSYPAISADEAMKALNEAGQGGGPIGIGGCATPVPHKDDLRVGEPPADESREGEQKPAAPCEPAGDKPAPEQLTVEKAVFGLAAQYVDGRQALVPSWLFQVTAKGQAEPFTVTHTAVEPAYLKSAEPPHQDVTPTEPGKVPSPPAISYSVDGRTLSVTFWGGVCSDYEARATESPDQVKVEIVEPNPDPDRVCIAIAKELTESVTLDAPLDGRKVVDASTGKELPRKG